jgi:hypothetical protein
MDSNSIRFLAIILSFILSWFIGVFIIISIFKIFIRKLSWRRIITLTILSPGIICLAVVAHEFFTSPMKVTRFRLQGNYVINRDLFKGEDTNWQYEHYWIKIKGNIMYLNVMNNGKLIRRYKKPIRYSKDGKHIFLEFDRNKTFLIKTKEQYNSIKTQKQNEELEFVWDESHYNSENHHMLTKWPKLHADPFRFNIVLQSEKYKNMFFTKGKWKNPKKKQFLISDIF